jgi:RNA polymerase sigma factor (sigma-70 family)
MSIPRSQVAELCAREAASLRHHLLRKLGDADQAEDVMQDAYVRLLSAPSDHATLRSPKAFLFAVATNLAIDSIRRRQRMRVLFAPMPESGDDTLGEDGPSDIVCARPSAEDQIDAERRLHSVLGQLQVLPAKCRDAFLLHKFMELSYAEVGERLGVSVSMVEKYVSRALAHVRSESEADS